MSRKIRANGVVRKSADTTWQTPGFILERARLLWPDRVIPFDPFTALDNPTQARRYCAGPPGSLFEGAASLRCDSCTRRLEPLTDADASSRVPCPACGSETVFEQTTRAGPCVVCNGSGKVADPDEPACEFCALVRRNGLATSWDWSFWTNPPFTREAIEKIGREAARPIRREAPGAVLLPCNRQEEPYYQEAISLATAVCYLNGAPFQQDVKGKPRKIAFISTADKVPVPNNPYASWILNYGFPLELFALAFAPLGPIYRHERIVWPGVLTDTHRPEPDEAEADAAEEERQERARLARAPYHPVCNPGGANVDEFGGSDFA